MLQRSMWALFVVAVTAACSPTIGPTTQPVEVLVVLDSLESSLRVVPVDSPSVSHTLAIPTNGSVANTLALNGTIAAIGLGDSVLIYDLAQQRTLCIRPVNGAGASTGSQARPIGALAFGESGEVYAATPSTDSIAAVFPAPGCGVSQQHSVAGGPQGFVGARGTVYVIVGNRETCIPNGLNCPSWLVPLPRQPGDSLLLTGPGGAHSGVFGPDGFIYVINAGTGQSDGRLSRVDPVQGRDVSFSGFGRLPQYIATDGVNRIYVTGPLDGLIVFNIRTQQIDRGPNTVVVGAPRGIATDDAGRVYLPQISSCAAGTHGTILVLGSDLVQRPAITAGRCPVAVGVTEIPAGDYHFN